MVAPSLMRWSRSGGSSAPSVRMVVKIDSMQPLLSLHHDRQIDINAQHIRRKLRLNAGANTALPRRRSHPLMRRQQFVAALPRNFSPACRRRYSEAIHDALDKLGGLLRRDVLVRLGVQQCFRRRRDSSQRAFSGAPSNARIRLSSASSWRSSYRSS